MGDQLIVTFTGSRYGGVGYLLMDDMGNVLIVTPALFCNCLPC
jgi:hypothetical protein